MVSKVTKRKVSEAWENKCACCCSIDILEFHHIIPKTEGGTDEYDNLILVCACCHAAIHNRKYTPHSNQANTSIDYELAIPILDDYFSNRIGTKEAKEKLHLSPKTHLSESSVVKRYKREHNIGHFYNKVDLLKSKRRKKNVPDITETIWEQNKRG